MSSPSLLIVQHHMHSKMQPLQQVRHFGREEEAHTKFVGAANAGLPCVSGLADGCVIII